MRKASREPGYPAVLFFFQGTPDEGQTFFAKHWPKARAVADADRFFYDAFDIERGRLGQLIGPRVVAAGVRAALKGNWVGRPVGDPRVMPGVLLVENEQVTWRHDFTHAGDHPDFDALAS